MTDTHPSKALVTGATAGIGRAVALKLAGDGFEVIVHGRDAERGAHTIKEIERSGGQARFLPADLGNPGEIRRLAEQAGDIDVLVNNAGFSAWGPTADLDIATFDDMFAANVRAPFYLVAASAPPNPRKSPRSSHSWPHPAPATSPARSSPWMGAAPRSNGCLSPPPHRDA